MCHVRRLSRSFIEEQIKQWSSNGVLGILSEDFSETSDDSFHHTLDLGVLTKGKEKPWEKRHKEYLHIEDISGLLCITLAKQIYIHTENVRPRALNRLRRLGAFQNPEY